ncbi:hypothetical protein MRX96_038613 [Rhipicephalus microplus]
MLCKFSRARVGSKKFVFALAAGALCAFFARQPWPCCPSHVSENVHFAAVAAGTFVTDCRAARMFASVPLAGS